MGLPAARDREAKKGEPMIYVVPLHGPIAKAVYGTFLAFGAVVALVQNRPWAAAVLTGVSVLAFWAAMQQWKAASTSAK